MSTGTSISKRTLLKRTLSLCVLTLIAGVIVGRQIWMRQGIVYRPWDLLVTADAATEARLYDQTLQPISQIGSSGTTSATDSSRLSDILDYIKTRQFYEKTSDKGGNVPCSAQPHSFFLILKNNGVKHELVITRSGICVLRDPQGKVGRFLVLDREQVFDRITELMSKAPE